MNKFTDIMVDIETTGTSPDRAAILQIAGVKFNYETEEVDRNFFCESLQIPANRFWDEGTRAFWAKHPDVYKSIIAKARNPLDVLKECSEWANHAEAPNGGWVFWAKPTHFDFSFMQSYFKDYGVYFPFHYRSARDLNSFISGLARDTATQQLEVDSIGVAHNAIDDCLYQIKTLFAAKEKFSA